MGESGRWAAEVWEREGREMTNDKWQSGKGGSSESRSTRKNSYGEG